MSSSDRKATSARFNGLGLLAAGFASASFALTPSIASAACGGGPVSIPSAPSAPAGPQDSSRAHAAPVIVAIPAPVASTVPDDETVKEARKHFDAGKAAFTKRDPKTAAREFKTAEKTLEFRASPTLSYYSALVQESLHHPKAAASYYQKYLDQDTWAQNSEAIEKKIASLGRDAIAHPESGDQPSDFALDNVQFDSNGDPFGGGFLPKSQNDVAQARIVANKGGDEESTGSSGDMNGGSKQASGTTKVRADRDDGGDYMPGKRPKYWWISLVAVGGAAVIVGGIFGGMSASNGSSTGSTASGLKIRF